MPLHAVLGSTLPSIFHIYDHQTVIDIDTYTQHQSKQIHDATFIQYDGKQRVPVSLRISPVTHPEDGTHTGWIIAFTDRTRELEIEDLKLDFVAAATHELRTPLTSVRGYAQMLHDEQDRLSDDGRMYLQRLETSAQYLARIKEVLGNLVTNAIHFTASGGTATVRITQKDTTVTVSVQDTGIGIPKDALPKLFTKFFVSPTR